MMEFLKNLIFTKAYAVNIGVSIPGLKCSTGTNGAAANCTFKQYINAILAFGVRAGFALFFLIIIYAGILYITSQGNQTKIEDAKQWIIGAAIGFGILLMIRLILSVIGIS